MAPRPSASPKKQAASTAAVRTAAKAAERRAEQEVRHAAMVFSEAHPQHDAANMAISGAGAS